MFMLLAIILSNQIIAFLETFYDRNLASVLDKGGRTQEENKLLHSKQMVIRGYMLLLSFCLIIVLFPSTQIVNIIGLMLFMLFSFWLQFNVTVNLVWLKEKWNYLGTTSKTDSKLGSKTIGIQLSGMLLGIALYNYQITVDVLKVIIQFVVSW